MSIRFRHALCAAICISATLFVPRPAAAQWAVIDASNLAQNVLQAARSLEQIDNQIQSLQNEAAMLQNEARNLESLNYSQLNAVTADLQQIGALMDQAQDLGYDVQSVETLFQQNYPEEYGSAATIPQIVTDAETRWRTARSAFGQTMKVQSQIVQTVHGDTSKLADLVNASQGATGSLQANQATNQLLALSIKQQLQVQTLLAAQGRAEALQQAGRAESEEAGRATFKRFIGDGNAYTPE